MVGRYVYAPRADDDTSSSGYRMKIHFVFYFGSIGLPELSFSSSAPFSFSHLSSSFFFIFQSILLLAGSFAFLFSFFSFFFKYHTFQSLIKVFYIIEFPTCLNYRWLVDTYLMLFLLPLASDVIVPVLSYSRPVIISRWNETNWNPPAKLNLQYRWPTN